MNPHASYVMSDVNAMCVLCVGMCSVYFKPEGELWDDYDGQDSVIFDNFTGTTPM